MGMLVVNTSEADREINLPTQESVSKISSAVNFNSSIPLLYTKYKI